MVNNQKPLQVEKHIVSKSKDFDFKIGTPELDKIKINKTTKLFLFLFFCVWLDVSGKMLFPWSVLTTLTTNV